MSSAVARKQRTTQADWLRAIAELDQRVPQDALDQLVEATLGEMRARLWGRNVAYAWSGGKDSQVIELLMERLGYGECLLAISNLEYPAFLGWVTEHMPPLLEVISSGHDLDWLAAHPGMLFPQDAATAAKWFAMIQHDAQRQYVKARGVDVLVLGRRHADGNYTSKDGTGQYTTAEGVTRYSPIRFWTHEQTLAFLLRNGVELAPFYGWPNGYRCGTHSWPARQWTGSEANGWREVAMIDRRLVEAAAQYFPGAALALERIGA